MALGKDNCKTRQETFKVWDLVRLILEIWRSDLWVQIQAHLIKSFIVVLFPPIITMTSWWARWRLKSPASRLFIQPFIQGEDQRQHQSSAPLAFVRGIHRWPVNSPHKRPVTRKMFPFADVIKVILNSIMTGLDLIAIVDNWACINMTIGCTMYFKNIFCFKEMLLFQFTLFFEL